MLTHSLLLLILPIAFGSQKSDDDFVPIFDGKTLEGWKALDMKYWSVRDGAITGQSTPENPCTSNQFMVWQGGDLADFELRLKFRVTGNGGNSGVQFRSLLRPDGLAVGYQADIFQSGPYLGGVCDELHSRNGPELLSANGKKTVIDASGERTASDLGTPATMRPPGEWNNYRIIARGQHIILEINGIKSTDLLDQEEGHFDLSGFLGLQLRAGEPMMVQFKDIELKKLPLTPCTPEPRTMPRQLISSGSKFEAEIGYSRAVVQDRWVFVSGTTGFDYTTMTISDDLAEQTEQCLKNISAALEQAGSSLLDVVRVTYVLPNAADFSKCWPILGKYFGEIRPAAMMIAAGLADPRMQIEIEVTALKQS